MNKLILNIGLNVGDVYNKAHEEFTLNKIRTLFNPYPYLLSFPPKKEGVSDWNEEQTLVVGVESITLSPRMREKLIQLCIDLKQDAIALTYNDKGEMIFNPNYKGERYEFKKEYFTRF